MMQKPRIFNPSQGSSRTFSWRDILAALLVIVFLYLGVRLAINAPEEISGPTISIAPQKLPYYTMLSVGRMAAAYVLSMVFTLVYGRAAAYNRRAEKVLMPLLDVLQSVPILSFLPVVLLGLSAFLPEGFAVELASIVLIFTSQVWNLTFAWYQSLTTIPKELREASAIFRLNNWMQFKKLELPFGMISLVWNSMMSWAGGWFFLMAAETFTVGKRDFRLPGLGSYLQEAANQNNTRAILWGIGVLILTVVLLDQFIWRPLLAWSDKFKLEMVENEDPPTSWFYQLMREVFFVKWISNHIFKPIQETIDLRSMQRFPFSPGGSKEKKSRKIINNLLTILFLLLLVFMLFRASQTLILVPGSQWGRLFVGVGLTTLRVTIALLIALVWTIPVGVAIGTNPRLAGFLQPIVQVAASVPATALFPVISLLVINLPGGLNLAAILLMLMGTQWYLLFNIIAGASAIPQDLKYMTQLLQLSRWQRWRTLILPAIFPYLITGAITASGGAWNVSIVGEYQKVGGQTLTITGIGSVIAEATAIGDYSLLLAATLTMVITVILINRLLWRRLYGLAEEKYRMES